MELIEMQPITPYMYEAIYHRLADKAGKLPRQYLLEYVVYDYLQYIIVVPAGFATYAVTFNPVDAPRRIDFTLADFENMPGAKVVSCLPHLVTIYMPFAPNTEVVKEEVACAFASYDAKHYDITSDLHKYEIEMAEDRAADYYADSHAA